MADEVADVVAPAAAVEDSRTTSSKVKVAAARHRTTTTSTTKMVDKATTIGAPRETNRCYLTRKTRSVMHL